MTAEPMPRDEVIAAVRRVQRILDDAIRTGRWSEWHEDVLDLALHLGDAVQAMRAARASVLVLAGCGHWWSERRPAGLVVDPVKPRVCMACRPDAPAAVGASPQGFAMVPVVYVDGWDGRVPR